MRRAFPGVALLIVDAQNDFLPGGALAVPEGDAIVPVVNDLACSGFNLVVATRDWHPADHCSFTAQGGPWPAHCVAGTKGADFPEALDLRPVGHIVHKGLDPARDSYSAFFDNEYAASTGLDGLLRARGISGVVVCGLALDFCVAATARDALRCGFWARIVPRACRAIAPDAACVLEELRAEGIMIAGTP